MNKWARKLQHLISNFMNFMNLDLNRRFITVDTYIPFLRVCIYKFVSYFFGFAHAWSGPWGLMKIRETNLAS